jgi:hypothetical protein
MEHTGGVVIGPGPDGEYAAGTLAEAGLRVTGLAGTSYWTNREIACPAFCRAIEDALKELSGVGSS